MMNFSESVTYAIIMSTEICSCRSKDWVSLLEKNSRCLTCNRRAFVSIKDTSQFEGVWDGCGMLGHEHVYIIADEVKNENCGARLREEWLADSYQLLIMSASKLSEWMLHSSITGYDARNNYEVIFRIHLKRAQDMLTKSDGANLRPWEVKMLTDFYENTSPQQRMNLRIQWTLSPMMHGTTAVLPNHNDILWELLKINLIVDIATLRSENKIHWLADKWFLGIPMTENVIVNTTLRELHKATLKPLHLEPFPAMKMEVMKQIRKAKFKIDVPTIPRNDPTKPGSTLKPGVDSHGIFPSPAEFAAAKNEFEAEARRVEDAEREAARLQRERDATRLEMERLERVRRWEQDKKEKEEADLRRGLIDQQKQKEKGNTRNQRSNNSRVKPADTTRKANPTEKRQVTSVTVPNTNKRRHPNSNSKASFGTTDIRVKYKFDDKPPEVLLELKEGNDEDDEDILDIHVSKDIIDLETQEEDEEVSMDEVRTIRCISSDPPAILGPKKRKDKKESWSLKKKDPRTDTDNKSKRIPAGSEKPRSEPLFSRAGPSKIIQTPAPRKSANTKLMEARMARLEPERLSTLSNNTISPTKNTQNTKNPKIISPQNNKPPKTIKTKATNNIKIDAPKTKVIANETKKIEYPVVPVKKAASLIIPEDLEAFISKSFDTEWKDGSFTPPLQTSSYKVFSPERAFDQLALPSPVDPSPADISGEDLGLLDESAESPPAELIQATPPLDGLTNVDELLGESTVEDSLNPNTNLEFQFTPTEVEDDIEEIKSKRKGASLKPMKANQKMKTTIKKALKSGVVSLVKPKSRKAGDRRLKTSQAGQDSCSSSSTSVVDPQDNGQDQMEVDEDDVPLSQPMTGNQIKAMVIKNELKKGKEGRSDGNLLEFDDMMDTQNN